VETQLLLFRKSGKTPFTEWLDSLKDSRAVGIVRARLNRLRLGNFGDCKTVGDGVEELRIDFGPGYRVYFGRRDRLHVLVLCAGDKRTQNRDVLKAKKHWKEYLDAKGNDFDHVLS